MVTQGFKQAMATCVVALGLAVSAWSAPLDSAARSAVIGALATQIKANYVFPDVAEHTAAALREKAAQGGYDKAASADDMAVALTEDLQRLANDKHFRVEYDPDFKPEPETAGAPSAEQIAEERADAAHLGWGLRRVDLLAGNVGYLDVRGFAPAYLVGPAYQSALQMLSGTEALIVDLRQNHGGDPASVALLLSYLFAEGDERHLNDIYIRTANTTREFWTSPAVALRYTRPVYVLTSGETFSGGEECAYDLQTQRRATLIGETTGGGANPVAPFALPGGLVAGIPTGRPINPITHANWEHVGVKPDVPVAADKALQTAWQAALQVQLKDTADPGRKQGLQALLARLDKGEAEMPVYRPRRR